MAYARILLCRYKIYIEGSAWSVSEKYILACDSVTLLVNPHYYDFFTRGMLPGKHYWPVKEHDKCRSIKFAVDWGNQHTLKVTHYLNPVLVCTLKHTRVFNLHTFVNVWLKYCLAVFLSTPGTRHRKEGEWVCATRTQDGLCVRLHVPSPNTIL